MSAATEWGGLHQSLIAAIGQRLQDDLGASQQARLACKHWQHRVFEGWSSSSLVLTAGAQQGPDAARRLSTLARIAPYISHLDVHVSSVQDLAHMAEDTHETEVAHQSNLNEWGGWMRALLQTGEQLELQSMSVLSSSWSHLPGWHEHRLPLSQPDCAPFLPASVEAQVTADHLPSSSGTHQAGTMAFLSSSLHAGSSTGNINERASGSETSSLNRDQSSGNQTSTSGQSYVPVLSHFTYLELLGCILPDRAQPQVAGLPALPARPLTGLWSHLPALVCLLMPDVNVRTADQAQAISTGLPHLQELVVGVHIAALPAVVSELVGIPALLRLELRSFPNWLLPKLAECLEQRHSLACEKHQAAMEVAYWRRRHANSVQNIQGLLGCAQPDTALQRSQALPESKLDGHSPRNDEGCLLLMHSPRKAYGEQGAKRRAYTSQLVPLSSPRQSGRLPMHTVNEVHAGAAYSTNGMPLPAEPLTLGLKLLNSFSPALYAGQGLTAVGVAEPPMPSHATPSGQLFARIAGCTRMCMLELRLPGRAALDAGTIAALASTAHSLRQLRLSVEGPLAASVVAAVASMQVADAAGLAHVRQACDRQVDELLWEPLTQLLSQLTELETFGLECHLGCLWLTPKATECMQACTAAKVAAAAVPSSTPLGGRASCKLSGTSSGSNGGTAFQRTRVKHLTTLELRLTTGPPHTLASPVLSCKGGTFSPSSSAVPSSPRRCRKYGGHAAVNGAFWAVPSERQTVYAGSSGPLTEMLAALPGLRTLTVDVLPKTWGFLFSLHNTLGCPYTLLLGRPLEAHEELKGTPAREHTEAMISYELDLAHPGLQALGYVHCTGRVSVIVSDDNLRATKIGQACAGGSGSVSVPRSPHDWSAGAAGAETVATKCRDSMLQAPPGLSMPATCGRLHTLELQRASLGAACSNMQWDPYTTDADAALAEAALGMAGRTWARLASSGAGSTLTRLALWGVEGMDLAQAAAAAAQAKQLRWLLLIQEPTAPTCVLTEVCAAVAKATGWVYGSALRARLQDAEARQPANAFLPTSPHKESTVSSRWQDGAASPRSPRAAPQGSSSQAARGRPRSGVELGSAVQAGQGSPWPRGSPGPAKVSALCSPRSNKRTLSTLEAERGAASASAAPSAGLKHGPPGICAPNAGGGGVLGEGESWHSSSRSGATGSSSSSCSSKILAGSDTTCVGLLHRTCSSLATLSALRYLTLVLQGVRACQAPTARAWSAAVADPASPLRTLTQIKALELGAMEPRSAAAARAAVGGMLPQLSDLSFVVLVQGRITRVERAANMSYV